MEFVFFWVALAIVAGVAANARGRSGIGWFLLALVISPVIAGLLVLVMKPKSVKDAVTIPPPAQRLDASRISKALNETKVCPECAEEVKKAARICRFCRHEFAQP